MKTEKTLMKKFSKWITSKTSLSHGRNYAILNWFSAILDINSISWQFKTDNSSDFAHREVPVRFHTCYDMNIATCFNSQLFSRIFSEREVWFYQLLEENTKKYTINAKICKIKCSSLTQNFTRCRDLLKFLEHAFTWNSQHEFVRRSCHTYCHHMRQCCQPNRTPTKKYAMI